jgi:hypothetical protein
MPFFMEMIRQIIHVSIKNSKFFVRFLHIPNVETITVTSNKIATFYRDRILKKLSLFVH